MIRTKYCQSLMDSTYAGVAIEAIKNGFDGAWERLIAERLHKDYLKDHSEANEIIDFCKVLHPQGTVASKIYLYAASLITSSTIQTHELPKEN